LASKAGFLFIVAPALAAGQFAAYVFYSTVALVLGRLGAFGLSDQLVLEIRGQAEFARRYHPLYRGLFLAALVLYVAGVASGSAAGRTIALCSALIAGAVLEGALRSVWPSRYEQLLNGPPVLFLLLVAVVPSASAVDLLALYGGAILVFQAWLAARSGFWSRRVEGDLISIRELVAICRRGFAKMIAEMTLLLNMRGLILWPKLLGGGLASDSLSMALAIGEAVSTLPMVVVNRNFARYASAAVATRRAVLEALLVVVLMGAAGLVVVAGWELVPARITSRLTAVDLAWALLLFGAVTAYYDLRYLAWTRTPGTWRFTGWQSGFFIVQGIIVAWLDQPVILMAVSLLATGMVLGWIMWSFRSGAPRPGGSGCAS